jgi:hypothetical protein
MDDVTTESDQSFFKKLFSGGFRLVDVYWAGYSLVGGFFALIVSKLDTVESIVIGDSLKFTYFIFISIAVWKSANTYQGKKVWAILAKVSSAVTILASLFALGSWAMYVVVKLNWPQV